MIKLVFQQDPAQRAVPKIMITITDGKTDGQTLLSCQPLQHHHPYHLIHVVGDFFGGLNKTKGRANKGGSIPDAMTRLYTIANMTAISIGNCCFFDIYFFSCIVTIIHIHIHIVCVCVICWQVLEVTLTVVLS